MKRLFSGRDKEVSAFVRLIEILIGGILLLAALSKISDLPAFAKSFAPIGWLPSDVKIAGTLVIPAVELALATCLIADSMVATALFVGSTLFCVFLGYNTWLHYFSPTSHCGCFGSGTYEDKFFRIGPIALNLILLTISMLLAAYHLRWTSVWRSVEVMNKAGSGATS